MEAKRAKRILAFGCAHFPYQNDRAVEVFCKAADRIKPDKIISLGDLLDCGQFSAHPPTYGMPVTDYEADLARVNRFLDRLQKCCNQLVLIEGNHEYRIDRWAAATAEGRGAYTLLAPRRRLTEGRKCTYVPYGGAAGTYPHHKINPRFVAVHGWSYATNATKKHLSISQGKSIIHAHTHRADSSIIQNVWSSGKIVSARSAGCLCKLIPIYGTGTPVEWVNAFILGYLGRHTDTMYTIPIIKNQCILPDGTEIKA